MFACGRATSPPGAGGRFWLMGWGGFPGAGRRLRPGARRVFGRAVYFPRGRIRSAPSLRGGIACLPGEASFRWGGKAGLCLICAGGRTMFVCGRSLSPSGAGDGFRLMGGGGFPASVLPVASRRRAVAFDSGGLLGVGTVRSVPGGTVLPVVAAAVWMDLGLGAGRRLRVGGARFGLFRYRSSGSCVWGRGPLKRAGGRRRFARVRMRLLFPSGAGGGVWLKGLGGVLPVCWFPGLRPGRGGWFAIGGGGFPGGRGYGSFPSRRDGVACGCVWGRRLDGFGVGRGTAAMGWFRSGPVPVEGASGAEVR